MPRTKGARGKHNKVKPEKEKKKRGRPKKQTQKQYQHQTINVNVNSSGNDSTTQKQHQPKQMQIPLSVYDSSLVSPHYGINDRQPTNPLVDAATDFMTPFLQAMIKNQKQTQQPTTQQLPTKQPIIITPPIQEQKETATIIKPPPTKKPGFTHEDVQHLVDEIHQKQDNIPEPIPQDIKPPPVIYTDLYGFDVSDRADGIRIKDKTLPFKSVMKTAGLGVLGGIGVGLAGPSLLNGAITTAASGIGYSLYGDTGAAIGNLVSSGLVDKYNHAYPPKTAKVNNVVHESEYQELPISNYSSHVNGGTTVLTRNTQQRVPSYMEPQQRSTLIGRLGDAIKDVKSSQRPPASQKVKESKLLLDLENRQKTYGSIQSVDVQPSEQQPSLLTNMKDKAKDLYRRLSGQKKGAYTRVPTQNEEPTQTSGTYAAIPQQEPEIDLEAELEMMNRRARNRQSRDPQAAIVSQLLDQPQQQQAWPLMEQFQQRNERNIRDSIERTNIKEKETRILQGLTPRQKRKKDVTRNIKQNTNAPEAITPKQQNVIENLKKLVGGSMERKKANDFNKTEQQAARLIERRLFKNKKEEVVGHITGRISELRDQISGLSTRAAQIQTRREHELDKNNAIIIQNAFRNKRARDETGRRITNMENQLTRTESMLRDTRSNINEQRPAGLRKQIKGLQDRRSELVSRARGMDREQKKEELRQINIKEDQYKDVIIEKKRGPKVKELVEQYQGAAMTPPKKK